MPVDAIAGAGRRIAARALDCLVCLVLLVIPILLVPAERVLARLTVAYAIVVAYEAMSVQVLGATPGKHILGLRVSQLDRPAVEPRAAIRRGMLSAFVVLGLTWPPLVLVGNDLDGEGTRVAFGVSCALVAAFVGLCAVISAVASPHRRGFADRTAETVVLDRSAPAGFGAAHLSARAASKAPPVTNPAGPAAPFHLRRRARASRFDDAPVLVLLVLALGFALSVPEPSGWVFLVLGLAWLVVFVVDEGWRTSRYGRNGGHRRFGLAVVDRTGEAASPMRSVVRALVVGLELYGAPALTIAGFAIAQDDPAPGFALALASLALLLTGFVLARAMAGRSLHDLVAGTTVVVVDEPEAR